MKPACAILIILTLLACFGADEIPESFQGQWLKKELFEDLSKGVQPKDAIKNCGPVTAVIFKEPGELVMIWNFHEGAPFNYKILDHKTIETLDEYKDIPYGMKYRMSIVMSGGERELIITDMWDQSEHRLSYYPSKYYSEDIPKGLINDMFIAGDYYIAGNPDSVISFTIDGDIVRLGDIVRYRVKIDCVELIDYNFVKFHRTWSTGSRAENFIWDISGDTLIFQEVWIDRHCYWHLGDNKFKLVRIK